MADYFDRLLARSVPGYPSDGPVVTPRLPQLYEQAGPEPEQEQLTAAQPAPTPRSAGTPGPAGPRGPSGEVRAAPPQPAPHPLPEPVPVAPQLVPVPVTRRVTASERTTHEMVRDRSVEKRFTTLEKTVRHSERIAELQPQQVTVVAPLRQVEPRRVTATRRAETRQPQVVQVSIGRIEVTAPPPQRRGAARVAPQRPAPVLSLEHYLAREEDSR